MNFKESLDYLFGLGYERSVKKFGLENTYILLNALGNPQKKFIKVQVAGTNGKGSTCAFLESILVQAGIKVGVNTSPHLVSVTERIRVNGADISERKFAEYVTRVRVVSENLVKTSELEATPTFFEHITAIAQLVFADEGVEVAVLEVGLGGRFDATTATEAEIVVITPIDLDHTKTLGDTIEKIAAEKAAIIRKGVEAVVAEQKPEALGVILEKCRSVNLTASFSTQISTASGSDPVTSEIDSISDQPPRPLGTPPLEVGEFDSKLPLVCFETENGIYTNVSLSLPGRHQIENAKVAILLAETLIEKGLSIEKKHIEKGLENAVHPGRLEYSDGILFDGAHNVAGAEALREYLNENISQKITMIFAAMGGKNLDKISHILFPLAENIIFTTPDNPRARPAKEVVEFVPDEVDGKSVFIVDEVVKALEKARKLAGNENLILVTGSLYLIGEIKAYLKNRKVERKKKKTKH